MPKGKILMGKKTPKPSVPPKPKGKNPPEDFFPGKPGDLKQMPSFLRKKKPVTRRGGK